MKILCLTTRLPYPTLDGRSFTLAQRLKILSSKNDLYVCTFNQGNKNINLQPKYIKETHILKYPNFIGKIFNVFLYSFIMRKPIQMSVVYSRKSMKIFDKIISTIEPDIIICDMLRLSKYLKNINSKIKIILDLDDLLSIRYKRNLERSNLDYLGQFKDSLPNFAIHMIQKLHLSKPLLKFEYRAVYKSEIAAAKKYNKIILVSPKETKTYNDITNTNKAICWPMCIESNSTLISDYDEYKICFLGNIDYAPNQDTLNFIINNIFKQIKEKYTLLVVGKCSNITKEKYKNFSFVQFTQEVPSIDKYVKDCLCLLAPIQYGSGIKTKVLECMSLCIPVITSKIGIEGLSVSDGKNILVADTVEEYVQKILLLSNRKYRNYIAENALNYVKSNHSFEKTLNAIENTFIEFYKER